MHDLQNVVTDEAFWAALVIGALGTTVVLLRLRGGDREPGVALVVLVACVAGLRADNLVSTSLLVALGMLLLGEWLTRDNTVWAQLLASAPGALVLGAVLPDGWPFWIRAVVVGSTVAACALVSAANRAAPRWIWLLLAISGIGLYFCVPDTEAPKALLGALLAAVFVVRAGALQPTVGATAVAGLYVWIAGLGGVGRPGSIVGGIACLGVVLLIPFVRSITTSRLGLIVLVAAQCGLVAYESRSAGFEISAWTAFWVSIPAFVLAMATLFLVRPRSG